MQNVPPKVGRRPHEWSARPTRDSSSDREGSVDSLSPHSSGGASQDGVSLDLVEEIPPPVSVFPRAVAPLPQSLRHLHPVKLHCCCCCCGGDILQSLLYSSCCPRWSRRCFVRTHSKFRRDDLQDRPPVGYSFCREAAAEPSPHR